ncbi:glycosyl hydrolases family 32 superfamily [Colletotrichum truncatum]|uniref:Glycosyl hydrolases family 32 superfamily n=1 Tax=Colletotrichum truncatum TaxID=5467 RepID=A0ACC3YHH2_COLTU|nr:glycosyl hydrolases family 32 superfamily [Colletotrichum truncatum]KAF6792872.1 glycosyl hydrolases family 32 superfamily [Colletotrichum truncatum]
MDAANHIESFEQASSPVSTQPTESSGTSTSGEVSRVQSCSTSVTDPDDSRICGKDDAFGKWRPIVHLIAPQGWLNDPCAPGYDHINDCYHVGFQWNPDSPEWGNISWGAATSNDLVSWSVSRDPSIIPTKDDDPGGVFTGCLSPVELYPGELTAFYTSARILPIHHTLPYNYGSEGLSIATSKNGGRTWDRHEGNTVLPGPPPDMKVTGWRDPFVSAWPSLAKVMGDSENTLYGIVSGGLLGQGPTPFIYRLNSNDITEWSFLSSLISMPRNFSPSSLWPIDNGVNWEVTNFLSLQDPDDSRTHDFLIMGVEGRVPQESDKGRSQFSVDHGQLWMCGKLEARDGRPTMEYLYGGYLDHGSFYAGNSFWDPKTKKRIIIGWVIEEDLPSELRRRQGWSGLLSLPRVVKLQRLRGVVQSLLTPLHDIPSISLVQDGVYGSDNEPTFEVTTLCAVPDRRLRSLRGSMHSVEPTGPQAKCFFPQGCPALEMMATFDVGPLVHSVGVQLLFAGDNEPKGVVMFDASSERLTVQRHESTTEPGVIVTEEKAPHTLFTSVDDSGEEKMTREPLSLHMFFDVSVLEVFANDRTALTTRLYADVAKVVAVEPFVIGSDGTTRVGLDALRSLTCWELRN